MKAGDVLNALRNHYASNAFIFVEECPVGTGAKATNRIDAFVMSTWPSDRNKRVAFEVKVSRADFKCELGQPAKRRPALFISNQFFFVTPAGLLKPEEIPTDCGLMEVHDGRIKTILPAPERDSVRPTWNFVAALLRKIQTPDRSSV